IIRKAMHHALSLGYNSDSKQLVAAIVEGSCYSEIHGIVADITIFASSMEFVYFRFCNRNSVSFEVLMLDQKSSEDCPTPITKRKVDHSDLTDISSSSKKLCTKMIKQEKEKKE
ncbi:hypothetical protein HID58_065454, partial [Brassica napus]